MTNRIYRTCTLCKQRKRTIIKNKDFVCKSCRGFKRRVLKKLTTHTGKENFPYTINDIDLEILLCLEKEALTAKQLSTDLKLPLSSMYKRISRLCIGGFLDKIDSLYFITERTKKVILNFKGWDFNWIFSRNKNNNEKQRTLRFHALQGRYIIEKPPNNYEKYLNKYLKIPVGRNRKLTGFKFEMSNCLVTFYNPTSISVTLPDIFIPEIDENHVGEGYSKIGILIDVVADKLHKLFPGLKISSFYSFGISNQHIAIRNSKYAQKYHELNHCHLNKDGLLTDLSDGFWELEATNSQTAGKDINKAINMELKHDEKTAKNCAKTKK